MRPLPDTLLPNIMVSMLIGSLLTSAAIAQNNSRQLNLAPVAGRVTSGTLSMWMGLKPLSLPKVVAGRTARTTVALHDVRIPEWVGETITVELVNLNGRRVLRMDRADVDATTRKPIGLETDNLSPGVYGLVVTSLDQSGPLDRWIQLVFIPSP